MYTTSRGLCAYVFFGQGDSFISNNRQSSVAMSVHLIVLGIYVFKTSFLRHLACTRKDNKLYVPRLERSTALDEHQVCYTYSDHLPSLRPPPRRSAHPALREVFIIMSIKRQMTVRRRGIQLFQTLANLSAVTPAAQSSRRNALVSTSFCPTGPRVELLLLQHVFPILDLLVTIAWQASISITEVPSRKRRWKTRAEWLPASVITLVRWPTAE